MTICPLVSIVIPSYNHERFIQDCIKSVIDQDYENIELIIIDDGSIDRSVEKIKQMIPACETRFTRFRFINRNNKGLSATLNEAIEWCKGKYYSAIASDDILFPTKTSTLLKYLEEDKDLAGVFCGCYILNNEGTRIAYKRVKECFYLFDELILQRVTIIAPTQLLRLDALRSVGGYRVNLYIEDWYMWLVLSERKFKLRGVDLLLVGYRQHPENSSKNALKMLEGRIKIMSFFAGKTQYKKAMSIIYLSAVIHFSSISKIKATRFLFMGVGYYKKIVFSDLFIKCFLRVVIPRLIIVQVKIWRRVLSNTFGTRGT